MATIAPPSITALPSPPDPANRATFNSLAYPWSAALPTFSTEVAAVATNVKANADDCATNATTATTKAAEAVAASLAATTTANAAAWVNGGTYGLDTNAISGIDHLTYRKKTASSVTTTDPSADATNWVKLGGGGAAMSRSARTSNTMLVSADSSKLIDITSGTFTQTFDAAATLADGWYCFIRNSGTGTITLDPNASELIDGAATSLMYPGECRIVQCTGAALNSVVITPAIGNHYVSVNTGNGYGSTNTKIRKFTTTLGSAGTAITYATSATLGASFTINEPGLYAITYVDGRTTAVASVGKFGLSLNTASPTTEIQTQTTAVRLAMTSLYTDAGVSSVGCVSIVTRLVAGDVVRPHAGTNAPDETTDIVSMIVRKVGI